MIRDKVMPAYATLLEFVRNEYIPNARKTLAAEDLPDGKAYYRPRSLGTRRSTLRPHKFTRSASTRWR